MSNELKNASPEQLQAIRQHLLNRARLSTAKEWGGKGLAAGIGLAGAGLLIKGLSGAMSPPQSSFTQPVEAVVYRPDREKSRRGRKRAESPVASVTSASPPTTITKSDPMHYASVLGSALVGLPLGFLAANKLSNYAKGVARHNELLAAQREFEKALQEYAEAGDEPRKLEQKKAAMSTRERKIAQLAENCDRIAKEAAGISDQLMQGAIAYAVLSPLLAGAYGFKNQWDKRNYKDLEIAERQLNIAREKTSPTFTVARLQDPPDLDSPVDTEEDEAERRREIEQSLQDAVETYQTSYL